MTPDQCRVARCRLALNRADLAARSGISQTIIVGFERGTHHLTALTVDALRAALEEAGTELAAVGGPKVARLRERDDLPSV